MDDLGAFQSGCPRSIDCYYDNEIYKSYITIIKIYKNISFPSYCLRLINNIHLKDPTLFPTVNNEINQKSTFSSFKKIIAYGSTVNE